MRYLALLYGAETEADEPAGESLAEELRRYDAFDRFAGEAILAGEALTPTVAGATVREGVDGAIVTDGVFTEATEVVGGYYVLDADDLDRAVELARRIPAAETGAVELRPVVEWFQRTPTRASPGRRYLALLAGEEDEADHPGTPAWDAAVEAHERFGAEAGDAILAGAALHPSESGTLVRVRGGELLVTEGVYAEAAEVIGGLYVLAAPSLQAAAEFAALLPIGSKGVVQLRPIMEFG